MMVTVTIRMRFRDDEASQLRLGEIVQGIGAAARTLCESTEGAAVLGSGMQIKKVEEGS